MLILVTMFSVSSKFFQGQRRFMTTLAQFEQLKAAGYNTIPVYRQRLADTETPLSVFARFKDQTQAYLFESVEGGKTGRATL